MRRSVPNRPAFDVFLSYPMPEQPQARIVHRDLKSRGLKPWADWEQMRPGFSTQEMLEKEMLNCGAAAVLVGAARFGKWQIRESRAFVREFVELNRPVIPVLLPGAAVESLPIFLRDMGWVDLRHARRRKSEMTKLVWGITGEPPETSQ